MASAAPSDPAHQQVMSAQYAEGPRLQGETQGPDYGTVPVQPEDLGGLQQAPQINGHPPPAPPAMMTTPAVESGVHRGDSSTQACEMAAEGPLLPGVAARFSQQATLNVGSGVTEGGPSGLEAPGVSPATGQASFGARPPPSAGNLFPSPLPGASPASQEQHGRVGLESVTARAATWMSRIGDLFQQRRVEVHTTWSPAHGRENPWVAQQPFVASSSPAGQDQQRERPQSNPPSTGSAAVPYEVVQAEVSKQLEGAMGELYGTMMERLENERRRTEEAEQQAQMLREQLEVMEAQTRSMASGLPIRDENMGVDLSARPSMMPTVQGLLHPPALPALPYPPAEPPGLVPSGIARQPITKSRPSTMFMGSTTEGVCAPPPLQSGNPALNDQGVDSQRPPAADAGRGRRFLQGLLGFGSGGGNTKSSGPVPMSSGPPPMGLQQPPAVASTNIAGSDQVLTAMARGIESLLLNQGNRNDRPETVKPGITELPPLPLYTPETGSIDLINWVTHITPIMEDLSDSSSVWWTETLQDVMSWYARYSVATPLERVQLLPIRATISKPEWARVERRATAMMLTAIPQSIKEEVIAVGGVTTVNLMAKLFSTYQPGNRQEKALVLANLEKPGETSDAKGAVEALRKWALWRRRAMAIGITEPDASVLLQGLDRICGSVVKADSELAFRVSLIRSTLQVDTCPTSDSVTRFFQHLQAELEQQARLGAVRGTELNPRLKALGSTAEFVPPPAPPAPTTPSPKQPGNQC